MKASLKWLKDYVNFTLPPTEIARRLTLAGLEVKDIQQIGGNWENIVIGQIITIAPHPNADRLKLITVAVGTEQMTVVTGAPNIKTGGKVAFARVGADLIDGHTGQRMRLKPAKIRGVMSSGMALSEKELGISENHEGILILPEDAPIGVPLADYLGDAVFDLEVTPNRADCLSIIGLAREIAALTIQMVRLPDLSYAEAEPPIGTQITVEIVAPDLCPRYCASLITGVKIAPSPEWMQKRLTDCGMRPINNIVDITNYVMLEYGQPLHAFDYSRIRGKKIIVRRAVAGEKMFTLDGLERALTRDMLVIADAEKAVALAGIMGGADSEVTEYTTSILLEAANFKPASIYHSGHDLGLASEARLRFERGIRPEVAPLGLKRATQLIAGLAGGKAARGIVDVYPGRVESKPIRLLTTDVKRLLGVEFNLDQILGTLTSLGFECRASDSEIWAKPPYWRNDIRLEVDLIEEVARIIGYDKIPQTLLGEPIPPQNLEPLLRLKDEVRQQLTGYGLNEIVTYSLVSLDVLNRLAPVPHPLDPNPLRVANPMTADQEYLRPTLRGGLLSAFSLNRRYDDGSIRLFELDKVYIPRPAELPDERYILCGIMGGPRIDKSWYGGGETLDFFDAKGVVEGLFAKLGIEVSFEKGNDEGLHPNKQTAVIGRDKNLGVIGEVHPKVQANFEILEPVYLFELDINALLPLVTLKQFQPIPRFPAITRDIALVVDYKVTHRQVQEIIKSFTLVKQVTIFDLYTGGQVLPGKKSLAYRLTYQSPDHTLTDAEVNEVQQKILDKLLSELGATLRQ